MLEGGGALEHCEKPGALVEWGGIGLLGVLGGRFASKTKRKSERKKKKRS